jgi:hypothetical protein
VLLSFGMSAELERLGYDDVQEWMVSNGLFARLP